jgi:hypothetical protein
MHVMGASFPTTLTSKCQRPTPRSEAAHSVLRDVVVVLVRQIAHSVNLELRVYCIGLKIRRLQVIRVQPRRGNSCKREFRRACSAPGIDGGPTRVSSRWNNGQRLPFTDGGMTEASERGTASGGGAVVQERTRSQRNDSVTRSRNCQFELRSCLHGLRAGGYEMNIKIPA